MADCPKCLGFIEKVFRSVVEIHEVDYEGEVKMFKKSLGYTKFRHECGYEFEVNSQLDDMHVTLVGVKEEEDA